MIKRALVASLAWRLAAAQSQLEGAAIDFSNNAWTLMNNAQFLTEASGARYVQLTAAAQGQSGMASSATLALKFWRARRCSSCSQPRIFALGPDISVFYLLVMFDVQVWLTEQVYVASFTMSFDFQLSDPSYYYQYAVPADG